MIGRLGGLNQSFNLSLVKSLDFVGFAISNVPISDWPEAGTLNKDVKLIRLPRQTKIVLR